MKTLLIAGALVAAAVAPSALAADRTAGNGNSAAQGAVTTAEPREFGGEVIAVDRVFKRLTIQDGNGTMIAMEVPPGVADLSGIETGERVHCRYLMGSAVAISTSAIAPALEQETMRLAPKGAPSGAAATVDTRSIAGRVEAIDRDKREILVRGPEGESLRLQVPADTPGFEEARSGDRVRVQYAEPVALEIQTGRSAMESWDHAPMIPRTCDSCDPGAR